VSNDVGSETRDIDIEDSRLVLLLQQSATDTQSIEVMSCEFHTEQSCCSTAASPDC